MKPFIPLCLFAFSLAHSQVHYIQEIVDAVNVDSLVLTAKELSGEVPVKLSAGTVTIPSRGTSTGRAYAAEYIQQRLSRYVPTVVQNYRSGKNIIGTQAGTSGSKYLICAHYDAVTSYAADDNASGTAAVIEAARLLSQYHLQDTLVYALWDQEESGDVGSSYYAGRTPVSGVVNIDMIAYDGNGDRLCEIHTDSNSTSISSIALNVNTSYAIGLSPVVYNPGGTNSDHGAFWVEDEKAIWIIEGYWDGDINPNYHTSGDRVSDFTTSYFLRMAKLSVGTIAVLAGVNSPTLHIESDKPVSGEFVLYQNYPNPFNQKTVVSYSVPSVMGRDLVPTVGRDGQLPVVSSVRLVVYDVLGREVAVLVNERKEAGFHEVKFDAAELASGVYIYRLTAGRYVESRKMLMLK